jgi:hypothetical protein
VLVALREQLPERLVEPGAIPYSEPVFVRQTAALAARETPQGQRQWEQARQWDKVVLLLRLLVLLLWLVATEHIRFTLALPQE